MEKEIENNFQFSSFQFISHVSYSFIHNVMEFCTILLFQLFILFCTPFNGSPLWRIADKNIFHFIYITRRNATRRRLFNLPCRTHSGSLPLRANKRPIAGQLMCGCLVSNQGMSLFLLSGLVTRGSVSSI